jgi:hypothetical protein
VFRNEAVLVDARGEPVFTLDSGDVLSIHGRTGEVFVGPRQVLSVQSDVAPA